MEANPYDGNLDQSDFKTPICKLNVAPKKDHFTFNNGDTVKELIGVRVLIGYKRRVMFGEKLDSEALCSSMDFNVPSPHIANPPAKKCSECVMQLWPGNMGFDQSKLRDDLLRKYGKTNARSESPACNIVYSPLLVDGNGRVFFLSLSGVNATAFKNLVWSRLTAIAGKDPKFTVSFDLFVEEQSDKSLVWYVIKPDNFEKDESDAVAVKALADSYLQSQRLLGNDYQQQDQKKIESKRLSAPIEINDVTPPEDKHYDFSGNKSDDLPF